MMKTSVAMCTFNGERFLKKQLDSILSQTIPIDEIIICDDSSTDGTQKILSEYQIQFPHLFKVYINDDTLKSVKNFEKAISLCTNDIIFLSDQDDLWLPSKVESFFKIFQKSTEIDVIASSAYIIDENENRINKNTIWDIFSFFKARNIQYKYFEIFNLIGNTATGANMAFRKSIINEIIPFPDQHYHHDEWIALVSSLKNRFYFLDEKTGSYRIHDLQQIGGVFFDNKKNEKSRLIQRFNPYNPDDSLRLLKRRFSILKKEKNKILSIKNYHNNHTFAEMLQSIEDYEVYLKTHLKQTRPIAYQIFKLLYF
ncbi:glycosyltransferase family 2 protein [Chryseobacterium sp.]|uniref:glycosyltransferase family 2 protein n=1 Tax=Chryseobacterium sp. TaxID=1871047 RepID=UPI0025BC9681|nr:glycosyltransferase family 2 protein [Chryseobacterium sp.]